MSLIPYTCHSGAIYDIDLSAPPSQRWKEAASDFGDRVHALLANLDEELGDGAAGFAKKKAMRAAARMARGTGASCWKETDSIANLIGVDPDDLIAANLSYDLASLVAKSRKRFGPVISKLSKWRKIIFGCTSASYEGPAGPVMVRNLDWGSPESVGEHSVRVRFHRGRQSYDALGIAGFVGVLSAQRPKRWAMAIHYAPPHLTSFTQIFQTPVCMHLRACADKSLTYDELRQKIKCWQTASPYFVHAIGAKRGERVVLSYEGGETYEEREPENGGGLVLTNHFADWDEFLVECPHCDQEHLITEDGGTYKCDTCGNGIEVATPNDDEDEGMLEDSRERFRILTRRLKRNQKPSLDKAYGLLKGGLFTYDGTKQSMVFCPANGHLDWKVQPNTDWEIGEVDPCPCCGERHVLNQGVGTYTCEMTGEDFEV